MENIFEYKLAEKNISLQLAGNSQCFKPTATSDFLIKAAAEIIDKKGSLLDLGCGVGVVGVALHRLGKVKSLYASDLSEDAVEACIQNCSNYGIEAEVRQGSCFEPWQEDRFDYVIDDISGIAEGVAKKSTWFENAPCNSGPDGTLLVGEVIKQAKDHLNKNGTLVFPIISLSNRDRILEIAEAHFNKVECILKKDWFLPDDLEEHIDFLSMLRDQGLIQYSEKFGKIICTTEVFFAS